MRALTLPLGRLTAAFGAGVDRFDFGHQESITGTRSASAHNSSYPTVPACLATTSAERPSPHSVTGAPTPESACAVRSTASISIDTRPIVTAGCPATNTGA